MKNIEVDELKRIQIDILDFVDEFCKKHNIKYFLTGGTLIGAIRHKGYIPWDDDIDICMLRDDYDRFIDVFHKENSPVYKVLSHTIQKGYPYPYAKVSNDKTVLKEDAIISFEMGVNIDVFPLDTIPTELSLQKNIYKKFNLLYGILQLKRLKYSSKRAFLKNVFITVSRLPLKLIPNSYIIKKMHKNAIRYSYYESPLCGDVVWGYGIREITKKEYFKNFLLVDFEGKQYSVPIGFDSFLKGLYGDYMQLPPEEKRDRKSVV